MNSRGNGIIGFLLGAIVVFLWFMYRGHKGMNRLLALAGLSGVAGAAGAAGSAGASGANGSTCELLDTPTPEYPGEPDVNAESGREIFSAPALAPPTSYFAN